MDASVRTERTWDEMHPARKALEDIRSNLKIGALIFLLFCMAMYGGFIGACISDPHRRRKFRTRTIHQGARLGQHIFGLKMGKAVPLGSPGSLLVSNHLSYLDVVAISARQPTAFITSVEVRDTPVLGWLTRAMGCLYVERRSRDFLTAEISEIASALKAGVSVTLFPEGTSSNGAEVLRFRAALLDAARDVDAPITPICLYYTQIDGRAFSFENHGIVCYYGENALGTHLSRLLRTRRIEGRIEVLPFVHASDFRNRYELAAALHEQIAKRYPGYLPAATVVKVGTGAGTAYSDEISSANC